MEAVLGSSQELADGDICGIRQGLLWPTHLWLYTKADITWRTRAGYKVSAWESPRGFKLA